MWESITTCMRCSKVARSPGSSGARTAFCTSLAIDVEAMERVSTSRRETERVPTPIVGVAPALDEAGSLEDVDDGDDVRGVVCDLIADPFL